MHYSYHISPVTTAQISLNLKCRLTLSWPFIIKMIIVKFRGIFKLITDPVIWRGKLFVSGDWYPLNGDAVM